MFNQKPIVMKNFRISILALAATVFFLTVSCEKIDLTEEMMSDPTEITYEDPIEEPYQEAFIEDETNPPSLANPVEEESQPNDTLWNLEEK
jgi:hypothetical protein